MHMRYMESLINTPTLLPLFRGQAHVQPVFVRGRCGADRRGSALFTPLGVRRPEATFLAAGVLLESAGKMMDYIETTISDILHQMRRPVDVGGLPV